MWEGYHWAGVVDAVGEVGGMSLGGGHAIGVWRGTLQGTGCDGIHHGGTEDGTLAECCLPRGVDSGGDDLACLSVRADDEVGDVWEGVCGAADIGCPGELWCTLRPLATQDVSEEEAAAPGGHAVTVGVDVPVPACVKEGGWRRHSLVDGVIGLVVPRVTGVCDGGDVTETCHGTHAGTMKAGAV